MNIRKCILLLAFLIIAVHVAGQETNPGPERCGTVERLEEKFRRNPLKKVQYQKSQAEFSRIIALDSIDDDGKKTSDGLQSARSVYIIPVVFHIVLPNPNTVTDAQVRAQLDTLNKDFFGSNGDSIKIPSYFKSLYGKSGIQFCLAQQSPDGEATDGIERVVARQNAYSNTTDAVKHYASGGADIWDNKRYLNIWICTLSNGIVGYSSFPDDGQPDEEGVVIDYRAIPGGAYTQFSSGRTLTHETGHFFNLLHIWGDDDGGCNGSDFVGDTPNQSGPTVGCFTGIRNDNCTPGNNGVMYQNFMDYSNDNCMALFTTGQATRMEAALMLYYGSLLNSGVCQGPVVYNYDVQLRAITQPPQRLCINTFTPVIRIQNRGVQILTSLVVQASIDDAVVSTFTWTGSLERLAATNITLPALAASSGYHTLKISLLSPNNNTDEDVSNNVAALTFHYFEPVSAFSESFEGTTFPPPAWDIVNPDLLAGWSRATGVAKTGNASAVFNNFKTALAGQRDDLRLPNISIPNVDSVFLSFQVAAAAAIPANTVNATWDTLEVLISTDCGENYSSVYKKFGSSLVTRSGAVQTSFVPNSSEWRKDSINLAAYRQAGTLVIAFRNTSGNQNNIYLDDVRLRTVTINPNLKAQGILVSPNPARNAFAVQFYPQPVDLRAVQLFNMAGQKVAEVLTNGQPNNYYNFETTNYQAGTYVLRAVFTDRVVLRKVVIL